MLKIDRAPLDSFLMCVENLEPLMYSGWSRSEKIAFFINAYNALVLKTIIDHYPITPRRFTTFLYPLNSIAQIGNVFRGRYFSVMGKKMTLHYIETEILQNRLEEPAVQFALVRGTMGCPPLLNTPYTGELLYHQLEKQTVGFLNKADNFRIDSRSQTVYLSAVLKGIRPGPLYREEKKIAARLCRSQRELILYLSQFLNVYDKDYLLNRKYQLRFKRMDWRLNLWK